MSDAHTLCQSSVRRAHERASRRYDDRSGLCREIADRMLERLDLLRAIPQRILDLGSGTGYCAQRLRERYRKSDVVELDFAIGMLRRSSARAGLWRKGFEWLVGRSPVRICADMARLPLVDRSFDMVWSNLALYWTNVPDQVLSELWRVMRPGGVLVLSTLGPDTLKELRAAWAGDEPHVHVNRFVDMHDLGDLLVTQRFADPVIDMECLTLTYPDVDALVREIKSSGGQNSNARRNPALSGKTKFAARVAAYERLREGGRIPATYEVVYAQAFKPELAPSSADGRSIIRFYDRAPGLAR